MEHTSRTSSPSEECWGAGQDAHKSRSRAANTQVPVRELKLATRKPVTQISSGDPPPPPTRGQEVPSEIVPQLQAQSVGSRSFPEPTGGRVVKRQVDQVLPSRLTLTQTRVRCRCSGARPAGDKPAAGWRCGPWGGGLPPGLRCVCKLIWLCKAMTPRSTCASVPGACPYKQPPAGRLSKPSVLLLLHRRTVAGTAPALVPERI